MNIQHNKPSGDRGSALAVTLLTATVLATLVGSYFLLIQTQSLSVARSQRWNEALVVAEGGVDEALGLLNSGIQAPNFAIFPWTGGSGVYKNDTNRPASKFGDSYYEVYITNAFVGANPVIVSSGHVPGPIGSPGLTRTIRIEARPRATFPVKGPMIVMQSFDSNGNNVGTDSFDSTVGPYNPSVTGTNGDVVTLTTNANSVVVGNGNIRGSVRTPPGGTLGVTATVGSQGSIGSFDDNFLQAEFPDAVLPNVTAFLPPLGGLAPDGLRYDNLLTTGNYQIADLTGSVYVGQTNTVLYVTGSISIGSGGGGGGNKKGEAPPQIHIAPGASLTVYMAGATTSIGGNGVVNDSAQASAFAYYGLPTNTRIDLTGNGSFFGTIYAPQANFNLKGSGNTSVDDFTGASITRTTTMTGNFNFHYDESLIRLTTLGGYDATSWEEL